jgi:hypothetical protein
MTAHELTELSVTFELSRFDENYIFFILNDLPLNVQIGRFWGGGEG